jgi:hypothetical protein
MIDPLAERGLSPQFNPARLDAWLCRSRGRGFWPGPLTQGLPGVPQDPLAPRRGPLESSLDRESAIGNAPARESAMTFGSTVRSTAAHRVITPGSGHLHCGSASGVECTTACSVGDVVGCGVLAAGNGAPSTAWPRVPRHPMLRPQLPTARPKRQSEKYAKLGQHQPSIAALSPECMGRLASSGPT